jgi:hypothetical protein
MSSSGGPTTQAAGTCSVAGPPVNRLRRSVRWARSRESSPRLDPTVTGSPGRSTAAGGQRAVPLWLRSGQPMLRRCQRRLSQSSARSVNGSVISDVVAPSRPPTASSNTFRNTGSLSLAAITGPPSSPPSSAVAKASLAAVLDLKVAEGRTRWDHPASAGTTTPRGRRAGPGCAARWLRRHPMCERSPEPCDGGGHPVWELQVQVVFAVREGDEFRVGQGRDRTPRRPVLRVPGGHQHRPAAHPWV